MLTCKEAGYLASKKLDKKLTLREKMAFSFHTTICSMCRRYIRDMNALHKLLRKVKKTGKTLLPESTKLSEQSRERIKQAIGKVLHPTE